MPLRFQFSVRRMLAVIACLAAAISCTRPVTWELLARKCHIPAPATLLLAFAMLGLGIGLMVKRPILCVIVIMLFGGLYSMMFWVFVYPPWPV